MNLDSIFFAIYLSFKSPNINKLNHIIIINVLLLTKLEMKNEKHIYIIIK